MLEELSIKNFAIIDELSVSFGEGLTVLTGETGAGKSIIMDAISLLIGGRSSVEYVRHGENRAEIEGLFRISPYHPSKDKLEEAGIEVEEGMVVLRRDITAKGKSVCRINGKLVTLAILREAGQSLVDIHGQHEHHELMQPEKHITMLDRFSGRKLQEALDDYKKHYDRFTRLLSELKKWKEIDQEAANRLDFIAFQLQEIEEAQLIPGEDEELEKERHILANSEKLYKQLHSTYEGIYGEGKALDWASHAMNDMEEAARIDENVENISENIHSAYYMLEEAAFSLRSYIDTLSFHPERLNEIEARLAEIKKLKRKYGSTVNEILEYAAAMEEEKDTLENKDQKIQQWQKELESLALDLLAEAETLTDLRRQAADVLSEKVKKELQALYMEKARMQVEMKDVQTGQPFTFADQKRYFNQRGKDKVEFLLATNAGEPLKPLAKVASGGEISRIMLALKAILSDYQHVTTFIFDEVDTGVSGRVAQAIAQKIYEVSIDSQVLCISHLPQVAAMADHHLYIEKAEKNNRVMTTVHPINGKEKTDEIARMMSGVTITELTRENAHELLTMADKMKSKT
ncbi:DNA replication and repair protein RecN [Alteribacillus persepolensis]|uniref:DNA repair protein RecN n=1 Tax=Alteribacillus persepolensis TaxID=568899 RepID=A0A1G8D293_9BACI|nr:DNA repair protein RecN [Alteribacillus persepolensis]SDH51529.1 DNA replication and repair protein RecN [Alteribacillus persepolensis]